MNPKKIIFFSIVWALLLFFLFIIVKITGWDSKTPSVSTNSTPLEIWAVEWDEEAFNQIIKEFKVEFPKYSKTQINTTVFSDYKTYKDALVYAFVKWKWPDIFTFNNSDSIKLIEDKISAVDWNKLPVDVIRKSLDPAIWNELIESIPQEDWTNIEVVKWVAPAYDTLVMYSNSRYTKGFKLETWSWINSAIKSIKSKYENIYPLALWTWVTVDNSADIFAQMLLQDWISNLSEIDSRNIITTLSRYKSFWDISGDNGYSKEFNIQSKLSRGSFDYFGLNKTVMVFWYLKDFEKVKNSWISSTFLNISPFPRYLTWGSKTLIDYNYYSINSSTDNYDLASDFLAYLASEQWGKVYTDNVKYKLPTNLALISNKLKEKIDPIYNNKYNEMYLWDSIYVSFDKLIKDEFDSKIVENLDESLTNSQIINTKDAIVCKFNQIWLLTWFNNKCF